MPDSAIEIAVIGGSGFYHMDGMTDVEAIDVVTPFGMPSDRIFTGAIAGVRVAFLARHGQGHRLLPSELPARANIWALASLGVRSVLSISAVGSLRREVEPLHMVVPDQLIDRTNGLRPSTFFGGGIAAHVSLAEPDCPNLSRALIGAARQAGASVHEGGTLVIIEGPAFSTKAESGLYQGWGASIIGMTALPEAKLAREAGMCYATLACVTDYDTWHPDHDSVTVELVLANLFKNVEVAKRTVAGVIENLPDWRACDCCASSQQAIVTRPELVPEETKRRLRPILTRYPGF
jgi:5'-methylthioadenosine phosphorylase